MVYGRHCAQRQWVKPRYGLGSAGKRIRLLTVNNGIPFPADYKPYRGFTRCRCAQSLMFYHYYGRYFCTLVALYPKEMMTQRKGLRRWDSPDYIGLYRWNESACYICPHFICAMFLVYASIKYKNFGGNKFRTIMRII